MFEYLIYGDMERWLWEAEFCVDWSENMLHLRL